jgi:RNA polymerase sigma-70 factor (ECF subfamily)
LIEEALIERARSGDRDALVRLLRELETPLYRTAFYLMKNEQDALDATQEALFKVYRNLPSFQQGASFHAWAQRIVTNTCIDLYRKRKKVVLMGDEQHQEDSRARNQVEWSVLASDLKRAIERLPDPQRTAVVLRYVQEYPYRDIAEVMQVPINTVKSYLFRARKLLKEWLDEDQEGGIQPWKMRK